MRRFQTGRLYSDYGQRISYEVYEASCLFYDHDRGVGGEIDLGDIPMTEVTPEEILWQYDQNNYRITGDSLLFEATAIPELLEFIQMGGDPFIDEAKVREASK